MKNNFIKFIFMKFKTTVYTWREIVMLCTLNMSDSISKWTFFGRYLTDFAQIFFEFFSIISKNYVVLDFFILIFSLLEKFVKKELKFAVKKINFCRNCSHIHKNWWFFLKFWTFFLLIFCKIKKIFF